VRKTKKKESKVEVRLHSEEPERVTWQKQLLKQEWNFCHCNVWRNEDPNKMDYATWPLEITPNKVENGR